MDKFGPHGYVVFFGVLEIYSREFKTEELWKLSVNIAFLRRLLRVNTKKLKSILKNISKWEVEFNEDEIIIFIPKFKELLDEWTLKKMRQYEQKLRSNSGVTPSSRARKEDKEEEEEEEEESTYCANTLFPSFLSFSFFELFWDAFDDKKGKEPAIQSWLKIPNLTEGLCKEIIKGAKQYATERKNILDKGGTPKMAKGWLIDRRWEDEIKDWKEELREKYGN